MHAPDLFDGERPATIDAGVAHIQRLGDEVLRERADRAVADLPEGLVYAGFSWGAGPAQQFAQTGSELAELFVYPGDQHLFTDSSLPSYDGPDVAIHLARDRAVIGEQHQILAPTLIRSQLLSLLYQAAAVR